MENFYISSRVLGTENHLEVSCDGYRTVDSVPSGSWLFSGDYSKIHHRCIDSLLRLENVEVKSSPPSKWTTVMSTVGCTDNVPWSLVMPPSQYRLYVKNLINVIKESIGKLPKDYCRATWMTCSNVFSSLRPAKIDSSLYKTITDSEGPGNGALESFKPGAGGYASVVQYDRFGTRTGRLIVSSGPNILTIKKEHRGLIKSHFQDGKIVSLDFSSLEARIILAEAGADYTPTDLYENISQEMFGGRIPRNTVKVAVLSELYGASRSSLEHRLEMGGTELDLFISSIRSHFKTDVLRRRLKNELDSSGKIRNKFGRPLFLDGKNSDYLLVNTYAQSTGVDVSLLGFKHVLDRIGPDGIRPLFVLHDALILDVRGDRLDDVRSIDKAEILGYDQSFSLKAELL